MRSSDFWFSVGFFYNWNNKGKEKKDTVFNQKPKKSKKKNRLCWRISCSDNALCYTQATSNLKIV